MFLCHDERLGVLSAVRHLLLPGLVVLMLMFGFSSSRAQEPDAASSSVADALELLAGPGAANPAQRESARQAILALKLEDSAVPIAAAIATSSITSPAIRTTLFDLLAELGQTPDLHQSIQVGLIIDLLCLADDPVGRDRLTIVAQHVNRLQELETLAGLQEAGVQVVESTLTISRPIRSTKEPGLPAGDVQGAVDEVSTRDEFDRPVEPEELPRLVRSILTGEPAVNRRLFAASSPTPSMPVVLEIRTVPGLAGGVIDSSGSQQVLNLTIRCHDLTMGRNVVLTSSLLESTGRLPAIGSLVLIGQKVDRSLLEAMKQWNVRGGVLLDECSIDRAALHDFILAAASPSMRVSGGSGYLGFRADQTFPEGGGSFCQVREVATGGPAGIAGLCPGDGIVAIDGQRVRSVVDLQNVMACTFPSERLVMTISRNGVQSTLEILVGDRKTSGKAP